MTQRLEFGVFDVMFNGVEYTACLINQQAFE